MSSDEFSKVNWLGPDQPEPTPKRLRWEAASIVALTLLLNLIGNASIGLWDRDEPRYAVATREMLASGNWLVPSFNAEPRYHKPVMIYWLMSVSYKLMGDNPFGVRLLSALCGTGTCLAVWWLGRKVVGPRAAYLASLALATAPIVVVESKLGTIDSTLSLVLVSMFFLLWDLSFAASRRKAALFWVLMAVGVLLKGPVAPVLTIATFGMSWLFGGPIGFLKRLEWKWGVPLCLALTMPWYVSVYLATDGAFYKEAVGKHVIERVTTKMEDHGGFPGYYPVLSLALFFPWSGLVFPAVLGAWNRRKNHPAFGFVLGWMVGPMIVLELMGTKLIHYYLPAYPSMGLLVGWMIVALEGEGVNIRRWKLGRLGLGISTGVGVAATIGTAAGAFLVPSQLIAPFLVMSAVMGVGMGMSLETMLKGRTERAAYTFAGTLALFLAVMAGWLLPTAEPMRMSRLVGERLAELTREHQAEPGFMAYQEPGTVYAYGKPIKVVKDPETTVELLKSADSYVVPFLPFELARFKADPRLDVQVLEDCEGLNLNKGVKQKVSFSLVRLKTSAVAGSTPSGEKPLVK